MPVIYIDVLLCINLVIDFLLLCAVSRVLERPTRRRRLIAGAAIGALSSLTILLPVMPLPLTLLTRLCAAALMVLAAFPFVNGLVFTKTTFVLFIVSAVFAGICFGLWWLFAPDGLYVQGGVIYYDVPPLWLIGMTVISYGALCLYERFTRKRVARGLCYRIEIIDGDHHVWLRTLLDSGHSLTEPFSGASVIVVNEAAVKDLRTVYDPTAIHAATAARIRYIPFSSIGGEGMLAAFRPARVILHADGKAVDVSGVWIAPTAMLARGEYDALIGTALADRLVQSKEEYRS